MTLAMPKGESYREHVSSWLIPVRNLVTPLSEGLFTGTLEIKKITSFADRLKFRTWTKNTKILLDTKF